MAIVNMSNFSLFAFDSERENLLHELQKFKYVHFLNLNEDESLKEIGLKNVEVPESIVENDEEISRVKYIIDILSKYDKRETGIKAMKQGLDTYDFKELEQKALSIDFLPTYNQLRDLNTKKEALLQEVARIKATIDEIKPWVKLNSPIKNLNSFEQSEVHMGTIPKKLKEKLDMELLETKYTYFEVISEDKENLYILTLSSKSEAEMVIEILRNNSFSDVKLSIQGNPEEEISEFIEKIKLLEKEIEDYEKEMEALIDNLPDMEIVYDYLMNKKLRIASSENFLMTEKVNVIKGYIPTDMVNQFTEAVKAAVNNVYYLEVKEAQKDDLNAPILLRNSKFTENFESLTAMYALPKYNEVDPTPFLAPFYLIFFGMMGADLGYGLLMLIGTLMVLKRFNLSDNTRKFMKFFYYLSYSVMFWGILYGSIFGGIIPMKGLFNPAEDYNALLIISIGFGLIHIFYGLGIKAYVSIRDGKPLDALYDVGFWYLALLGAIGFLLPMVITIPAAIKTLSLVIMIIGMAGIVLFGARDAKSIGGRIGGGIYSLYGISGYVGDFVSYSRLMALGLAGGFIASAVNMMADMVAGNGFIGIIFAVIIFIGGQVFNLGLTLLSAYVHTIRLTFVEFFGKFYEGGGKGFNLFRSNAKYINLK
jgi:V/A-type H+-transporting ATPase subunit I